MTAVRAAHPAYIEAAEGDDKFWHEPFGFVLRKDGSPTVFLCADSALISDFELVGKLYTPDVAFLPIGDRFTMGPREAAEAARMVDAPRVVPIHYGTFDLLTGTPEGFASHLPKATEMVMMSPGEEREF